MSSESEFLKQLSGGTAANLVFVFAFLIYRAFSAKCKHSKCRSTSGCIECSAQEDSIDSSKSNEGFHRQIEDLENQLRSLATNLCEKRKTIIRAGETGRRLADDIQVVGEQGAPEKI